ncbi:hypothetical protein [Bailinhaonella thermotolerans]|uniref:Uncharacterized protein n=1 Tax=Bailinhaonella thermotolerans TaxID=1070861 RepID=A0A3A4ATL4_9ACTN|nr:hypothetical protein [Bailinhaonella thermotolerans]RJL24758.1 hypothetical protein D5H75_28640 [Bailinhaonella thermotolerans]
MANSAPRLSNATRYLCAGAYLDTAFRDRAIQELVDDRHRAVVPSHGGVDVGVVARHCLNARGRLVVRDLLIFLALVIAVVVEPVLAVTTMVLMAPLAILATAVQRARPALRPMLTALAIGGMVLLALYLVVPLVATLIATASDPFGSPGDFDSPGFASAWIFSLLMLLAAAGVVVGYRVVVYRVLAGSLAPGGNATVPEATGPDADRLEYVETAQWGNVTLYSNENPFIGAGNVQRAWSIAVELDRARDGSSGARDAREPRPEIRLDPLDLHDFVRTRLSQMRDEVAHPAERIERLHPSDHVVAAGRFNQVDWPTTRMRGRESGGEGPIHPLVNREGLLPVTNASPAAIRALIRQPQGGVRYYQRVTVGAEMPPIYDETGAPLAPGADQEILVSAFIHLAVEGRMLYTQFVVTVLPPVRDEYHVVDLLPSLTPFWMGVEALRSLRLSIFRDILGAPYRLIRHGVLLALRNVRYKNPAKYVLFDYGARVSVRELGAEREPWTYMQRLDSFKYTRLIEERLTEAVLDYLERHNVDTAAYRQQAAGIIQAGTLITGGTFHGPTAVGAAAQATATTIRTPS